MKNTNEQQTQVCSFSDETEEKTVSMYQVLSVMFGRRVLLLVIVLTLTVCGTLAVFLFNFFHGTYVATWTYSVDSITDGVYFDGTRFDISDFVDADKLEIYADKDETLKAVKERVVGGCVVRSIEKVKEYEYKENENGKLVQTDNVKRYYFKVTLSKSALSCGEAKSLVVAIANEPYVVQGELVKATDFAKYLTAFDESEFYENKVGYLKDEYDYIDGRYTFLIDTYGDVIVGDNRKVSDARLKLREYFYDNNFSKLLDELSHVGYISDESELDAYHVEMEKLKLDVKYCESELDELKEQRASLLDKINEGTSSSESIALEAYNEKIISLTTQKFELEKQIELLQKKLDNYGREDTEYAEGIELFDYKLDLYREKLSEFAVECRSIFDFVIKNYSNVYFDDVHIIHTEGGEGILKWFGISLLVGFVVGIVVNLCLDWKKFFKNNINKTIN